MATTARLKGAAASCSESICPRTSGRKWNKEDHMERTANGELILKCEEEPSSLFVLKWAFKTDFVIDD